MNYFYVGFYYPDGMINELLKLGSAVDFPGYTFQSALLSGLDDFYPELKVISSVYMSSFPRNKKMYFKKRVYSHKGDCKCKDVFTGVLNLPGIKFISEFIRIRRELKRSFVKGEDNIVICYEVHSPFLIAIASLRKKISKTCLIVPDLPEFMTGRTNKLYLLAKRIDKKLIDYSLKYFDCFVLFSPLMKEKLQMNGKPWVQVEGIYKSTSNSEGILKEPEKVILYSGSLGLRLGVVDLLKAFHSIEYNDYRLWICGAGDGAEVVKQYSSFDSRIQYLGVLPREKVLALQKKATLLINPRHRKDEFTRYSFPSKTMEYLASGTPTLMSHLDSIPAEYDSHIFYFKKETIEGMKESIIEICERDKQELKEFGASASKFIIENKSPIQQAKKVFDLISSL